MLTSISRRLEKIIKRRVRREFLLVVEWKGENQAFRPRQDTNLGLNQPEGPIPPPPPHNHPPLSATRFHISRTFLPYSTCAPCVALLMPFAYCFTCEFMLRDIESKIERELPAWSTSLGTDSSRLSPYPAHLPSFLLLTAPAGLRSYLTTPFYCIVLSSL